MDLFFGGFVHFRTKLFLERVKRVSSCRYNEGNFNLELPFYGLLLIYRGLTISWQ